MMRTSGSKAENNGVIQSSIGLLQERFRQLQRMKEMRENKELLRIFSDYKNTNPNTNIISNNSTTNNNSSAICSSNNNDINSNNEKILRDSTMQLYNENNNKDDELLQIFIPPNYLSINNRKSSCYSSSSTTTSTPPPPSTSSLSSYNKYNNSSNSNNMMINLNDVSLSLWSFNNNNMNNNDAPYNPFRPGSDGGTKVAAVSRQPSTCVSTFYKLEDPPHVSDVDTTLHL